MAESRIQLTCRYCGDSIFIGKGGFGRYITGDEDIFRHLNGFYKFHANGGCVDASDYSNDAKNFFVILEEGETLSDILPTEDNGEWTNIAEDGFPEEEGEYFVWNAEQRKREIRFFFRLPPNLPVETNPEVREYFGNSADHKKITHWMPLPDAPKGE